MKKIRILVSTLLISTMLLSLVGCGDKKENDGSDKGNKSQTEQKSDDNKKEENFDEMEKADEELQQLLSSEEYKKLSIEEKVQKVEEKLQELANSELIIKESIYYDNESKLYTFSYKCGVYGSVMVGDFNDELDTVEANEETSNDKQEEKKSSYKKDPDLDQTLEVGKGTVTFAIDAPTGWGRGSERTGWAYTDLKRGLYVIYDTYLNGTSEDDYEVDLDSIKSADQVIEGMAKQFVATGMGYLPIEFSMKREYEIIKKENVSINGWDMCRYEGKFILDDNPIIQIKDKKAYFVAYTVIKDGFPIYFAVVDGSDAQEQSAIVAELADKIAKTFRRYEDK